jgi:Class II flagellar assembly regulator
VINKVDGPSPLRGAQPVRRAVKTESSGGTSFARTLEETSGLKEAAATGAAMGVSGILGIQEVDDALARAAKGKARAFDILDRLEDIRLELLAGGISKDRLLQLSRMVSARRESISDPKLAEILDDIDLRAQVELAKLGF